MYFAKFHFFDEEGQKYKLIPIDRVYGSGAPKSVAFVTVENQKRDVLFIICRKGMTKILGNDGNYPCKVLSMQGDSWESNIHHQNAEIYSASMGGTYGILRLICRNREREVKKLSTLVSEYAKKNRISHYTKQAV